MIAGAAFLPGDRTYPRCEALYVAWFRVKEPANSPHKIAFDRRVNGFRNPLGLYQNFVEPRRGTVNNQW